MWSAAILFGALRVNEKHNTDIGIVFRVPLSVAVVCAKFSGFRGLTTLCI